VRRRQSRLTTALMLFALFAALAAVAVGAFLILTPGA
jgi:hypothetical protein